MEVMGLEVWYFAIKILKEQILELFHTVFGDIRWEICRPREDSSDPLFPGLNFKA